MKSRSGKFEIWVEVVVEGDCCTPTRVHDHFHGEYETSEAMFAELNRLQAFCVYFTTCRYPEAYLKRMQKLQAMKAKELEMICPAEEVPF